jgi:hypothetical protein
MNVMIAGSNASLVVGTIATNGTLSEEFDLSNYTMLGLLVDNATNGTLNFWVAPKALADGGVYRPVYNADGTTYAATLKTGDNALSSVTVMNAIAPYRYVRLVTSVAQVNGPTCRFVVKA